MKYVLLLIFILLMIVVKENFASDGGGLIQLVAQGAQDVYLTGGPHDPIIPTIAPI